VFGAVVFGVMTLVTGGDPGLTPADPDTRARPLPADRPLVEGDVSNVTFDVTWRGYRMAQVDQTLRRLAYDLGYKTELIQVLEAEVLALRDGRLEDADTLADARISALAQKEAAAAAAELAEQGVVTDPISAESTTSTPAVVAQETVAGGDAEPVADQEADAVEDRSEAGDVVLLEPVESDDEQHLDAAAKDADAQDSDAADSDRPVASTARAGRSAR
jgi:DivIVA domain-containing protein